MVVMVNFGEDEGGGEMGYGEIGEGGGVFEVDGGVKG